MKIYNKKDFPEGKSWWDYGLNLLPEQDGLTPILVTNEKIEVYNALIINGKVYTAITAYQDLFAFVEETENQKSFLSEEIPNDCKYTQNVKCPFCGYENGDSWELDDAVDDHECGQCGSIFPYQRVVTVEYCSQPVKRTDVLNFDILNSHSE